MEPIRTAAPMRRHRLCVPRPDAWTNRHRCFVHCKTDAKRQTWQHRAWFGQSLPSALLRGCSGFPRDKRGTRWHHG